MKKFFMMLPLMVALVALVGCKKATSDPVAGEKLNEDSEYYKQFDVEEYGVFGEDPEMIAGTTKTVKVSESESVDVQLGYTEVIAWGDGVTYSEQSGVFSGQGWMVFLSRIPLYFVTTPGAYQGAYLPPSDGLKVATTSEPTEGVCAPGTIDAATYGDWINYIMFDAEKPDSAKIFGKTKGALFSMQRSDVEYQEWMYLVYRGFINQMNITLDSDDEITSWGADVNFSNMTGNERCYGFHFDVVNNDTSLTKPYNYRSVNMKFGGAISRTPANAPAKDAVAKCPVLRRPYPALKK